ncbi:hypothetical protein NONI108955_01285 [Nocardia ninae]|uniref:YbaB/EbfC DNA-binding family protein n=1 Tax=Nocardia ninae NBRC 108245 TaxID=1210091 RepID=A0A511MC22_9NOCA|nr:hypothetical protein [Nocardia ninae]GEM38212.1 hypothetical protein NN4_27310 [Nocardia ninae NBRC 108245]
MTDIQEWERQLMQDLADIRRSSAQLASAIAVVRGRGEVRGVIIEVDADGDITNLQIAPAAMRWSGSQLTATLLDCHRKARADAKARVERLLTKADPRLGKQLPKPHSEPAPAGRSQPTEEEIQRADDEYFERMNHGWTNNR